MALHDFFGLFTSFIALSALAVHFRPARLRQIKQVKFKILVSLSFLVLMLFPLPFLELPFLLYCRGLWGDLSIATVLLASVFVGRHTILSPQQHFDVYVAQDFKAMYWFLVIAGLTLYPFALGIGYFDPYSFGYTIQFQFLLIACAAVALWRHSFLLAHWIILSLIAKQLNIYESDNLFDILLDPLICLFALKKLVKDYI